MEGFEANDVVGSLHNTGHVPPSPINRSQYKLDNGAVGTTISGCAANKRNISALLLHLILKEYIFITPRTIISLLLTSANSASLPYQQNVLKTVDSMDTEHHI
jgi:hypothetical protein